MPKLSEVGNSDAVDSSYIDRAVVYVEASADSELFERVVGMAATLRVAFKAPLADGGGYDAVCKQVKAERDAGNTRVFGLLDGEAAATLGGLDNLIDAARAIFPIPSRHGIYFLAEHEIENLLLLHGDACAFIVKDVKLGALNSRSLPQVEAKLRELTRRFIAAAIIKYAALHLRVGGGLYQPSKGREFQNPDFSMRAFLEKLEAETKADNLDWDQFRQQIAAIKQKLRKRLKDADVVTEGADRYLLRLADGKGLLTRLRSHYRVAPTWDGHLADRLVASPYASVFRAEILAMVAA